MKTEDNSESVVIQHVRSELEKIYNGNFYDVEHMKMSVSNILGYIHEFIGLHSEFNCIEGDTLGSCNLCKNKKKRRKKYP